MFVGFSITRHFVKCNAFAGIFVGGYHAETASYVGSWVGRLDFEEPQTSRTYMVKMYFSSGAVAPPTLQALLSVSLTPPANLKLNSCISVNSRMFMCE